MYRGAARDYHSVGLFQVVNSSRVLGFRGLLPLLSFQGLCLLVCFLWSVGYWSWSDLAYGQYIVKLLNS